jgi:hypothetical protein
LEDEMKKKSLAELESLIDTHSILPDGGVVSKKEAKQYYKKQETCICMDCGKIFQVKNQSNHFKVCPKKGNWIKPLQELPTRRKR